MRFSSKLVRIGNSLCIKLPKEFLPVNHEKLFKKEKNFTVTLQYKNREVLKAEFRLKPYNIHGIYYLRIPKESIGYEKLSTEKMYDVTLEIKQN